MRGFFYAGQSPIVQPVLMIDYDAAVLHINDSFLKAVQKSADRFELIQQVLNRKNTALLEAVRGRQISEQDYLKKLGSLKAGESSAFVENLRSSASLDWETDRLGNGFDIPLRNQMLHLLEDLEVLPERWRASLWGSSTHFENVKGAVHQGRFVSVLTNVADPRFLTKLNEALMQAGHKVALIDLSNALDHMLGEGVPVENFVDQLQQFAFTPNARAVITFQDFPEWGHEWSYYVVPVAKLQEAKELGLLKNLSGYLQFLKQLRQGQRKKLIYAVDASFELAPMEPSFFQTCLTALKKFY